MAITAGIMHLPVSPAERPHLPVRPAVHLPQPVSQEEPLHQRVSQAVLQPLPVSQAERLHQRVSHQELPHQTDLLQPDPDQVIHLHLHPGHDHLLLLHQDPVQWVHPAVDIAVVEVPEVAEEEAEDDNSKLHDKILLKKKRLSPKGQPLLTSILVSF